jgi:hypothetical protein
MSRWLRRSLRLSRWLRRSPCDRLETQRRPADPLVEFGLSPLVEAGLSPLVEEVALRPSRNPATFGASVTDVLGLRW